MKLNDMVPLADLLAQFSMAHSARVMLGLTAVQIMIGIAGTIALIWTIRQAQRSQRLAEDAIKLQREMSQKELRAYLSIEVAEVKFNDNNITAIIRVRNNGNTPAITKCFRHAGEIIKHPMVDSLKVKESIHRVVISSSEPIRFPVVAPWKKTTENIKLLEEGGDYEGSSVLAIAFQVDYVDVFDALHTTKFSVQFCREGNGYSVLGFVGENSI